MRDRRATVRNRKASAKDPKQASRQAGMQLFGMEMRAFMAFLRWASIWWDQMGQALLLFSPPAKLIMQGKAAGVWMTSVYIYPTYYYLQDAFSSLLHSNKYLSDHVFSRRFVVFHR